MTAIMLMNHDNKVILSVDNHTWMETSLEALSDDIMLVVSQLNVICFYPTDELVNSPIGLYNKRTVLVFPFNRSLPVQFHSQDIFPIRITHACAIVEKDNQLTWHCRASKYKNGPVVGMRVPLYK